MPRVIHSRAPQLHRSPGVNGGLSPLSLHKMPSDPGTECQVWEEPNGISSQRLSQQSFLTPQAHGAKYTSGILVNASGHFPPLLSKTDLLWSFLDENKICGTSPKKPSPLPYLDFGLCRFRCDFSLMVNTCLACILPRAVGQRDSEVATWL